MAGKMDEVCKELDEVKTELEKLKEDYRIKTQVSETLRRASTDQLAKIQEAKAQLENQSKELNAKSEELAETRQLCEDIKSKLHETESSLRQVRSMNDKLRADSDEKLQKLEEENRKLAFALEDAMGRAEELDRKLHARIKEADGLKKLLSDSQRKCLEAEEKARAEKELRHRDDVISRLEEQTKSIRDQLKWKKEQFGHLEEAHKQLQDQFQSSKKEWASEKSDLLQEISTLQSKFDAQVRIAESLESHLKMCNQALAHEESRRKMLEVQLSESTQCFENVLAEYEEAKAKIESLNSKRDEEIASLRNLLGMKEMLMKEMDYNVAHLEQENKDLLESVKELQEAQINKRKVDPSIAKMRNKLKNLEQVHNKCALTLKEREAEWNFKMEKLIDDIKCYEHDLKRQAEQMHQLKNQLDDCHSALEVSGEETSILLMVLKSELSDSCSKLSNSDAQVQAFNKEIGEMGHCSSLKAQIDLKQAREEIASLTQKIESLSSLEEHNAILVNEIQERKEILEDALICQLHLKEQVREMEAALKKVSDALEKSNFELGIKINVARQAMMELEQWKSKAETVRNSLEQSQAYCKQMESSLLKQVETEQGLRKENESLQCRMKEQEQKIEDLHNNIATLEQKLAQTEAANEALTFQVAEAQENEEHYVQMINERDATVENLQKELERKEQQSARREYEAAESARLEAQNVFEGEKEKLCMITRQKDECIRSLQSLASSLEQNFMDTVLFSLSQGVENLVKIASVEDALKKTTSDMNAEVERKNTVMAQLEYEISSLHEKVVLQEESLSHMKKSCKEQLEALVEDKNLEIEKLACQLRDEQTKTKEMVQDLELEKEATTNTIKRLSSERDGLLLYMDGICEQIGEFCTQDAKLEEMLGNLLQNFEEDGRNPSEITSKKRCELKQKDVNYISMEKEVEPGLGSSRQLMLLYSAVFI
ncbi:hypothetical protein Cgig2_014706 [Carnegiea gigantea]|uniref:Uncharacterized protein n=1 Tax=Carnegiea gigantea TaxID=171969 RepID=A0A9Q1L1T7_9CARY|nr:hypothetical protein Cgig2_014706 [Carnegiea gigantea]